jgi:hypothetical protein
MSLLCWIVFREKKLRKKEKGRQAQEHWQLACLISNLGLLSA